MATAKIVSISNETNSNISFNTPLVVELNFTCTACELSLKIDYKLENEDDNYKLEGDLTESILNIKQDYTYRYFSRPIKISPKNGHIPQDKDENINLIVTIQSFVDNETDIEIGVPVILKKKIELNQ